jgi:hypothetical protein
VSGCCLTPKWAIFHLYHGENKLHLMRRWRCLLHTKPTRLVGPLAHCNNSPRVDMSFVWPYRCSYPRSSTLETSTLIITPPNKINSLNRYKNQTFSNLKKSWKMQLRCSIPASKNNNNTFIRLKWKTVKVQIGNNKRNICGFIKKKH